ncbi:MAG TPA: hypothetical protein VGK67_01010 [Myxococcales bacterium]|jgi:hypothetical protein
MKAIAKPGLLRALRRSSWEFQTTFETPLDRLPQFVHAIVGAGPALEAATLELDEVVFEPKHLLALSARHSILQGGDSPRVIEATGAGEIEELLAAALGDWVDFLFVPSPKPFVLYADHHEYATFFAHRRKGLTKVVAALSACFTEVRGYRRRW